MPPLPSRTSSYGGGDTRANAQYSQTTGSSSVGQKAIQIGQSLVGKTKYVWGGGRTQADVNRGYFDCSGFILYAFKQAGMNLGGGNTDTLVRQGTAVNPSQMQAGDLVFFDTYKKNGHVGIYLGNGKFIGSQSATGVAVADMNSSYWKKTFTGVVRRIGGGSGSTSPMNSVPVVSKANYANGDVRKISNVSAASLNQNLRGVLSGQGQVIYNAARANGIDPAFLAAIAMHESGNGSSNAVRNKNNAFGIMTSSGIRKFNSLAENINYAADMLRRLYISQGLTTPVQIQKKYAPVGATNDPTSLNKYWVDGVTSYWNRFRG